MKVVDEARYFSLRGTVDTAADSTAQNRSMEAAPVLF
jgi:hypothetical protein